MTFRCSDCVAAHVDYVESVDSVVCVKHAVSYFGASFGRIKGLTMYRSTSMLTGNLAQTFRTPTRSYFSIAARKNRRGLARLRGIQYRVSIMLA